MKTAKIIDRVKSADGTYLVLTEHHGHLVVSVDDRVLMSSAAHGSEEHMALRALGHFGDKRRKRAKRWLIGGLGLGYTLRATLDLCGDADEVVVAELLPAIVRWHQEGPLGILAGRPLEDARVKLRLADVRQILGEEPEAFDAILLDVDNGPTAMVSKSNARIYDDAGAKLCADALRPGGILVIWSARPDEAYVKRLRSTGLSANAETTGAGHVSDAGIRHWLFVGKKQ